MSAAGAGGATAIVVPGHGGYDREGVFRISPRCRQLVREAERLAGSRRVPTVVFSGGAPRDGTGTSEAEQMRAAWNGPDVELVVEPTAVMTAQNAARTVPLLVERAIVHAIVVCTPAHLYRTRFFFSRLYRLVGIEAEVRVVPMRPSLSALLREVVSLTLMRAQLRAATAEVLRLGEGS